MLQQYCIESLSFGCVLDHLPQLSCSLCLLVLVCVCLCLVDCAQLCSLVLGCHAQSSCFMVLLNHCAGLCWVVLGCACVCTVCAWLCSPAICLLRSSALLESFPSLQSSYSNANQASGCPKQLSTRCLAAASLHPSVPKSHPQTHTQADRSRFASLLTTSHPHRI